MKRLYKYGKSYGRISSNLNSKKDFRIQAIIQAARIMKFLSSNDIEKIIEGFSKGKKIFQKNKI
jgi:hypothetical protein